MDRHSLTPAWQGAIEQHGAPMVALARAGSASDLNTALAEKARALLGDALTRAEAAEEEARCLQGVLDRHLAPNQHRLVSYVDGAWSFQSPILPVFMAQLAQMLAEVDATNYIEIDGTHESVGPLTLTIQKRVGKTPHEMRQAAEAEVESLRAQISDLTGMRNRTAQAFFEKYRGLNERAKSGFAIPGQEVKAVLDDLLTTSYEEGLMAMTLEGLQGHAEILLHQRDALVELARKWVPGDDNGADGIGTTVEHKALTHPVDRILAGAK